MTAPLFRLDAEIPDGTPANRAWAAVENALLAGYSVELVRRSRNGKKFTEVRTWNKQRDDGSNAKSAEPLQPYTCPDPSLDPEPEA